MSEVDGFGRAYFLGRDSNYIFGYHRLQHRFWWRRRLRLIQRLLPSGRLLDVGCAFGFFLRWLGKRYETYGLDVSGYAIAQARRLLRPRGRVRQGDVQDRIPFSAPFDVITAFDVVEHLDRPDEALRHITQALRPGGYLVLECPTHATPIDRDGSHQYRPLRRWVALLKQAGLRTLSVQRYWTIGLRMILVPTARGANYVQVVAQRPSERLSE